jgi:hypothetical protein
MDKTTIIICSRDQGSEPDIRILSSSCGLSQREVAIHRVFGASSMGAGYNQGIVDSYQRDDSRFLVFTHDDVTPLFGRHCWDQMLKELAEPEVGFVGVAGPTGLGTSLVWWQSHLHLPGARLSGAITHSLRGQDFVLSFGPFGPVVALDGVWLAIEKKKLAQLGPWRTDGWHFYDIEMTLRSHYFGFTNVTVNLPLLHRSEGDLTPEWNRLRIQLASRLTGVLPAFVRHKSYI